MHFDRNRATLVASPDELDTLTAFVAAGQGPVPESWRAAGLSVADPDGDDGVSLNPTVVGLVEVLARPSRSICIERFDGRLVAISFVAWDSLGRVAMTEGADPDRVIVTATDLTLLPALLAQAVRLRPVPSTDDRAPVETTAGVIERLCAGWVSAAPDAAGSGGVPTTGTAGPETAGFLDVTDVTDITNVDSDVAAVVGGVRHAWRAGGSRPGAPIDASITVLSTGDRGLWLVRVEEDGSGGRSPETAVTLIPVTADAVLRRLGDVVTGRVPAA